MTTPTSRVFDHVLIIMLENEYRSYVLRNRFMRKLAKQGIELTNYCGVMHPSQTNYIASIAGELCNVTYDSSVYNKKNGGPRKQSTIVDLIEAAGLTWKAYMQNYPGQPWTPELIPQDDYPYLTKHDPFSSFEGIVQNPERWKCIVDEYQFWSDVINGQLPNYAWFTPNMWNDGHYVAGTRLPATERAPQLVNQTAAWLETLFAALQFPGPNSRLPPRTLVVVTFDEADYEAEYYKDQHDATSYDGPNQIYTVLLGDGIPQGTVETGFNHYSLLKTIERNFGLGTLGKNDAACNSFDFLWNQSFQWGKPTPTPLNTSGPLAAAGFADRLHVVSVGNQAELQCQSWDGSQWTAPANIGATCSGGVALAATSGGLMLVFQPGNQSLCALSFTPQAGWSKTPQTLVGQAVGTFALTALDDGGLMLAYRDSGNQIQSLLYANGAWATTPTPVNKLQTDGTIALVTLGPSLYLIAKAVGQDEMNVVSYNTAEFNVVTIAPSKTNGTYNNSTKGAWSPSAFPVAQFGVVRSTTPSGSPTSSSPGSSGSSGSPSGSSTSSSSGKASKLEKIVKTIVDWPEPEPKWEPHTAGGPLVAAELGGVIHLVHPGATAPQVSEETFSTSGILTPQCPVSYTKGEPGVSDGYGTLAQAGWTAATEIATVQQNSARGLTLARLNSQLILLFQSDTSGQVQMLTGTIE